MRFRGHKHVMTATS